LKLLIEESSEKLSGDFVVLNREQCRPVTGLLTDHCTSRGTYMFWSSENTTWRKCGQKRNPLAIYFVNAQPDRMKIFGSAWVELIDISRASIKNVLASAFRKGPSETGGTQWTQYWSECLV
jgi:hypothetical protein